MITFVHLTARNEPRWNWYVDSLCLQLTDEERANCQFVFVDAKLWDWGATADAKDFGLTEISLESPVFHDAARRKKLSDIVAGRLKYQHIPPLPNVYQGPFRVTSRDWFYAGINRNTGIVSAKHPYVMFCDDLAWPAPTWMAQVRHAAQHKYLLAGQYKKVKALHVESGRLISYAEFPPGVDSRWDRGSDGGIVSWHGSGVFGCSFGAPLENLLQVDGNGHETAMQGAEDYCLGIRLERTGLQVKLNRNCLTLESEEDHHTEPSLPRESKLVTTALPAWYNDTMSRMSDHVHLNRLWNEKDRVLPLIGNGLRAIRNRYFEIGAVPIPSGPTHDWRDDKPLSEL